MKLAASELILNNDGSIYHLHLKPEHIAKTIITVGDPDRVDTVTSFFDHIEFKTRKREFHTQTGTYKGKRISVISTGIGTDNIDIVFNELDALLNIDLKNRTIKENLQSYDIIRIGTSGAIQENIPINSFIVTETAIGFDSLLHYYQTEHLAEPSFLLALTKHLQLSPKHANPYSVKASNTLLNSLHEPGITLKGITATNVGFYAPQGRVLRTKTFMPDFIEKLNSFKENEKKITNLEMETSGIYAMSKILGHKAISMNAILANRITGEFSKKPEKIIKELIAYALHKIVA